MRSRGYCRRWRAGSSRGWRASFHASDRRDAALLQPSRLLASALCFFVAAEAPDARAAARMVGGGAPAAVVRAADSAGGGARSARYGALRTDGLALGASHGARGRHHRPLAAGDGTRAQPLGRRLPRALPLRPLRRLDRDGPRDAVVVRGATSRASSGARRCSRPLPTGGLRPTSRRTTARPTASRPCPPACSGAAAPRSANGTAATRSRVRRETRRHTGPHIATSDADGASSPPSCGWPRCCAASPPTRRSRRRSGPRRPARHGRTPQASSESSDNSN